MEHDRHYTVEEANAMLPGIRAALERLREAREQLGDADARRALEGSAPGNGGGAPGRVVSAGFLTMRSILGELAAAQVILRDLDRGLVDFPALREGREVYLCWTEDEEEIGFWHDPESGFGGRRPLGDG